MHIIPSAMPSQYVPPVSHFKARHCLKQLSQLYPASECVPRLPPGSNPIPDLAVAERTSEQNGLTTVASSRQASPVGNDTKVRT